MGTRGVVVGVTVALLALAACGDSGSGTEAEGGEEAAPASSAAESSADPSDEPSPEASVAGAAGFPLEVENCGRTLTFDAPPERVVTGYHPNFELVAELGAGDRLVGRTPYDEEGPDGEGVLPQHRELYDAVPEVSDTINFPAAEEMLALGADLVVSEGYYNFNADNGNATIEELAEAGTQVYITGGWCDADSQLDFQVDTLLDDVRTLGAILGVPDEGEALADELQGTLDEVAEATAGEDPARVVLVDASTDALYAMGQGMGWQLAELAGGQNPFGETGDTYGEYSAEEIAASDADAFVLITYLPTTPDERRAIVEEVAANTPAVTEGRFVEVPASATHPGYRTFVAVRDIAEALYPDAFAS